MGDRTSVTLTVPLEYSAEVRKLYADEELDDSNESKDLISFTFQDVNYGELPELDKLKELGIAFDSEWQKGGDFDSGSKHLRFDIHGVPIEAELTPFSHYIYADDIGKILKGAGSMVFKLTAISQIYTIYADQQKNLSWANQVEFGKLYRVNKLISPT